jgi:hypothetical protein
MFTIDWFKPIIADDYKRCSLIPISVESYDIRYSDLDNYY